MLTCAFQFDDGIVLSTQQAEFDADVTDTFMLARQLAPNTLFRGRGMGGKKEDGGYGDYNTPEETFPDKPARYNRTHCVC